MGDTVLQEDLTVEGNLRSEMGSILVKGEVRGDVEAKSVDVSASGVVLGAVLAKNVIVRGQIRGSIGSASVSIESGADMQADLVAETLSVEEGASVVGHIRVGANGEDRSRRG